MKAMLDDLHGGGGGGDGGSKAEALAAQFGEWNARRGDFSPADGPLSKFAVRALTKSVWPVGDRLKVQLTLPAPFQARKDAFEAFYKTAFLARGPDRKLDWLFTVAGDVQLSMTSAASAVPYDLTCNTLQAAILLLVDGAGAEGITQARVWELLAVRAEAKKKYDGLEDGLWGTIAAKQASKAEFDEACERDPKRAKTQFLLVVPTSASGEGGGDRRFVVNGAFSSRRRAHTLQLRDLYEDRAAEVDCEDAAKRTVVEAGIVQVYKARKVLSVEDGVAEVMKNVRARRAVCAHTHTPHPFTHHPLTLCRRTQKASAAWLERTSRKALRP